MLVQWTEFVTAVLEQAAQNVGEVRPGTAPARRARAGWAEAAQQLHARGELVIVELEPTRDSEIRKTRPSLVVSPDELNHYLRTVIVAPMTTGGHP